MSGFDLVQNPDGANFQAQAVLAYVRNAIGSGIEGSWDAAYHRYTAEPKVTRYDNLREQGYVVWLRSRDYQEQINIAFYEHRNCDSICAIVSKKSTFNAPLKDDILEAVSDSKWDVTKSVNYGQAAELAEWIVEQLNDFWAESESNVANRKREAEAKAARWAKAAREADRKARDEEAKKKARDEANRSRARSNVPHSWWVVLGVNRYCTHAEAREAWRKLALKNHPDNGGDTKKMQEINAAWTEAQRNFKYAA